MRSREPRWLTRRMLLAIQRGPIFDHHQAIVESALAAPRKLHDRDPSADLAALAAAYATALAQTHGFIDGSKRAAFLAAYVFLGLNGCDINAAEVEVAAIIERLASREMSEAELAEWLRGAWVFLPETDR
ncbi:MAG: type II toxin-antitoxin system death-on-curing family toxin [Gemmatimonadaceae bacterium]|nr:type II toxin-antitoxin system death-on-curing family toxin [Gemmatimonadaceae bacterium]